MNSTDEMIIRLKLEGKPLRSIVEESGVSLSKVRTILDSTKEHSTTKPVASTSVPNESPSGKVSKPKPKGIGLPYETWDNSETPEAKAKNSVNFP